MVGKLFLLFLLSSIPGEWDNELQDDGKVNASEQVIVKKNAYEIAVEKWLKDSRTLQGIVVPLRKYRNDYNDTNLMREEKKRQLVKVLKSINKKYVNTILDLSCVRCEDVKEEEVLSAYGKEKAKKIIKDLKKHPDGKYILEMGHDVEKNFLLRFYVGLMLAFCDKCFKPTGNFNVLYEIPVPQKYSNNLYDNFSKGICLEETDLKNYSEEGINNCYKTFSNVIIYKRLKNKNEALSIQKNSISTLKGTIEKIIYKGDIDELYIYVK